MSELPFNTSLWQIGGSMNKIIFLDIDGVLNSNQYWASIQDRKKTMPEMEFQLDPKCLRNLKKIVDETHSKIVVTSTWKRIKDHIDKFKNHISQYGLYVYDLAPCHPDGAIHRGDEIRQYLEEHKGEVDKFILLDDDEFPDFNELKEHWVKTSFYKGGLGKEQVEESIQRLGRVRKTEEIER